MKPAHATVACAGPKAAYVGIDGADAAGAVVPPSFRAFARRRMELFGSR